MLPIRYVFTFYESNSKKSANLDARVEKFSLKKITRTFENLQIPSLYFKEQSPKGKFEIKLILFYSYLNKLTKNLASVPTLKM